jgi:hypothetical protein
MVASGKEKGMYETDHEEAEQVEEARWLICPYCRERWSEDFGTTTFDPTHDRLIYISFCGHWWSTDARTGTEGLAGTIERAVLRAHADLDTEFEFLTGRWTLIEAP